MAFSPGKTAYLLALASLLALSSATVLKDGGKVEGMKDVKHQEEVPATKNHPESVGSNVTAPVVASSPPEGAGFRPEDIGPGDFGVSPEDAPVFSTGKLEMAPAFLPPPRVCGVFILCERKGGFFFGAPSAALIQGDVGDFSVRTIFLCSSSTVTGAVSGATDADHAQLWSVTGEEFAETCFYRETIHACPFGQVQVIKNTGGVETVEHECTFGFEAHTVEFCMQKNPLDC